jgi:predicted pyridoxine 5'-phosphate oxidase superfamily flavin-nucleotide-binding protein
MTKDQGQAPRHWDGSPFHAGERAVQARAGVLQMAERVGRAIIRDYMPEQHRELFEQLPYLLLASLDRGGRPWASLLAGQAGFVEAKDAHTLLIHAQPLTGDALTERLAPGAPVAVLGIELATRRRNRANGVVTSFVPGTLALQIGQSFGNCPKHITPRLPRAFAAEVRSATLGTFRPEGSRLSARARELIARADTFFIATAAQKTPSDDVRQGLDVSHRGGPTGFVAVDESAGAILLSFLDYSGNNLFNTLGNILQNPVAGLTFLDFERGDVLMLTGSARLDFVLSERDKSEGGERKVQVVVDQGLLLEGALPFGFVAI